MNLVRSEWTKLRSVRSTWMVSLGAIAASIGVSLLGVTSQAATWNAELPDPWDPTATSLKGLLVGQLLLGMLGALAVTSEYRTGQIMTTLSVAPRRHHLLLAKAAATLVVALGTAIVTVAGSFAACQAVLRGAGLPAAGIADGQVLGALIGAVLYLVLTSLAGLALGTVTRSSSGALSALVAIMLLAPALTPALPGGVGAAIARYWPPTAGQAVYTVVATEGSLLPWVGLGVMALFTLYLSVASSMMLRVRDA